MKFYLTEADKSRFIDPVWDELEYDPSTAMSYIDQSGDKFPSRETIIKWANSGAADKYKIDWQKFDPKKRSWKVEDAAKDIIQPYLDYLQSKEIKKDPKTSFSNKEDFLILHENEKYLFVGVLTYEGAIYCDSFKCGGAGAKWCIGYEKTDRYWVDYCINQEKRFVLVYNKKVFGNEFNQKYMLEVRNSDFYDQRVTCTGWKQDDDPEDTLSTKECIESFEFTQEQLTDWFKTIKDKIKVNSVDTFSMKAVMCGSKIQLSDKNQSVYLKDFDCDEFDYSTLLRNVRIGRDVRELISKGEGKDLLLTKLKMGPAEKKDHDIFIKAVAKPKIVLQNYNSVFIPDVWLSSSSPELLFMNCKTVVIGTLHLPSNFDPEDETCSDINALIKDFNRNYTTDGLHFENSNVTVTLGVLFFPRSHYCKQYPLWQSNGENPSAFITKWMVKNAVNGRNDTELLSGYKRAYIDFEGNKKYFENNNFDISKVVSDVPDNNGRIYCLNVPVGCTVIYSKHPDADVVIKYCNFNADRFTMTEENKTVKTKEFGDWAVVFWKKGSETLYIAQNRGDLGTTNYWMVGTTTRQFDYESGWLPNKKWTSTIKAHFSKAKAIQLAKENAMKEDNSLAESHKKAVKVLKEFDTDWMNDGAKLKAVKVEDLIEDKYLSKALEYYELFEELTLRGDYKKAEDRSEEDIEKDQKAIELLEKLRVNTDPALAYGFMLYDESSITKAYWKKRVGNRKDPHTKRPWTRPEKQANWLYEVYLVLTDQNPKYKDHLYYYKFTNDTGKFNIMNNFKIHWNMYMLPELARSIFKRNAKDYKSLGDSKNDFETTADYSEEDIDNFLLVEDFIRYFAKKGSVKANSGSSLEGLTWKKVLEEIIKNKKGTAVKLSKILGVSSSSVLRKLWDELKKDMKKFDINQDIFTEYISKYDSVALDILNGKDATFSDNLE